MSTWLKWTVCAMCVSVISAESRGAFDPVAAPRAVVEARRARFTVLTPRLIRMEWSPDGRFEDRGSFAFVNRRLPVPEFTVERNEGELIIRTAALTLRYGDPGTAFSGRNLSIEFDAGGRQGRWTPDSVDDQNLHGTWRTLDGVSGASQLEPGLLSRSGWTLVDDSQRLLFDDSDWPWAAPRASDRALDWYFFAYGHDYPQALRDFTAVAGPIPLPPRYVFGAWWSRYWPYTDAELRALVAEFRAYDVPLDVLVVDMDWHLDGWTGYTWNPECFPDPEGFLKWAADEGLRVPLNLHPAQGVGRHEAAFEDVARHMGLDPAEVDRVPFDCTDRRYVDAYFKYLHHPLERQGVDFWWMDWQQGRQSAMPGLDPLFWLNYLHWTDWERDPGVKPARPLIFSRWGGLGNPRYQIGFSGDTYSAWRSLAFQPSFTATAGNVGYGFWSHDIGGHQPGPVDAELYARWVQWGALSPVLRTHTTRNPLAERRIWAFGDETFRVCRDAWHLRYALIPYIYTAARQTHDTALPLCRPLYYAWPEAEEAYSFTGQYLFGDDLLVAPVATPVSPHTGCAAVRVWFPPGEWTDWFTGRTYHGPPVAQLSVPLQHIPLFVRSGAIIPTAPPMRSSDARPLDPLGLHIFGGETGTTRVYEDDGLTQGYLREACMWTPVRFERDAAQVRVTIGPAEGEFAGGLTERGYVLHLHNVPPATRVLIGEREAMPARAGAPGWDYDEATFAVVVSVPRQSVRQPVTVTVELADLPEVAALLRRGLRDQVAIVAAAAAAAGEQGPAELRQLAELGTRLVEAPAEGAALARTLRDEGVRVAGLIAAAPLTPQRRAEYLTRLLGLSAVLELVATDTPGLLAAELNVSLVSPLGAARLVGLSVAPLGARGLLPREGGAMSDVVIGEERRVRVRQMLAADGPLQTTVLTTEVTVGSGAEAVKLPLERVLLPSINAWWLASPLHPKAVAELDARMAALRAIDVDEELPGMDDEPVTWRRYERMLTPDDDLTSEFFVSFPDVHGAEVHQTTAYAVTFLDAPDERDASLAIGSDDGCVVWLNGAEVLRVARGRPYQAKEDRVPVRLRAGINTLVVRIDQQGGGWGFGVHVETPDGRPMPDARVTLTP